MPRRGREKHEAHHVGAGVQRGVEGLRRRQPADFHNKGHYGLFARLCGYSSIAVRRRPTSAKALPFYIAKAALSRKVGRNGSDRGRPQLQPFRCAAGWVGIGKHTGCPFHRVDLDAQVSDLAL